MAVRIVTLPGVFAPRDETWLLADVVRESAGLAGADVLELGTGSGAVAIAAAQGGARSVTVVDVSRRALVTATLNAQLNGVRVIARLGDLFAPVAGQCFDLIVSNPPYVPSPSIPSRGASRAWAGGADGRIVLERICARVTDHLCPGGAVLLLHSSVNDVSRTRDALERVGLQVDFAAQVRGPTGPLMSRVMPDLQEEGTFVVRARSALDGAHQATTRSAPLRQGAQRQLEPAPVQAS